MQPKHRNRLSTRKIHVLWLALFAPLLALLTLGACNDYGNYVCGMNPAWCQTSPLVDAAAPTCCTAPETPFSCTETINFMGDPCPIPFGICALNDGDAISQVEISAHNKNLTLAVPVVCVPSYCDPMGYPAKRRLPRHPLNADAGLLQVEDLDGGGLACEAFMADAGVCAANTGTCNTDNDCCSGICSESDVCEACRGMLEGCVNNSDCCSGICSLNACGGNAPGTGGGSP